MKSAPRTTALRSALLLLVLAWSNAASAQPDRKVVSYGFVSPNTKQNLKLEEAIRGMTSPAETNLRNEAINLSCVVRTRIRAFRALGAWNDGARLVDDRAGDGAGLGMCGNGKQQNDTERSDEPEHPNPP